MTTSPLTRNTPEAVSVMMKKAAKAVGEKSIAMIKSKELLPLTGYVHGGCSPIGMKKQFRTTIHQTAEDYPTIFFSGGQSSRSSFSSIFCSSCTLFH